MTLGIVGQIIWLNVYDAALIDMRWSIYVTRVCQVPQPLRREALDFVVIDHGLAVIFFCSSS